MTNFIIRQDISKEKMMQNLVPFQEMISYYRYCPDRLLDKYIEWSGEDCSFQQYAFQRVWLRQMARHKNVFITASRGTSKSFVVDIWCLLSAILYPGSRIAIVSSTKSQSSSILEAKFSEIFRYIPALYQEVQRMRNQKDQLEIFLKNGSYITNVAAKESSRGLRFTSVILEEIASLEADKIQEIIIPMLAIQRRAANGKFNPNEVVTQQQICITTAGSKGSYAHNKCLNFLVDGYLTDRSVSIGASYKLPIIEGLQNRQYIRQQQIDGNLNPASFRREFGSEWTIGGEDTFFNIDTFDKHRILLEPQFEMGKNIKKEEFYIIAMDVGRHSDSSAYTIWRIYPQIQGGSFKYLVNIVNLEGKSFDVQILELKRLWKRYSPRKIIIDTTGIGVAITDLAVKPTVDPDTMEVYPPFGIENDEKGYYDSMKSPETIKGAIYQIKGNAPINTQMYTATSAALTQNKMRFLQDSKVARLRISSSRAKGFKEMTEDEKADYLLPFVLTDVLKEQMANLRTENEGVNIILKRDISSIHKDLCSSVFMAMYWCKEFVDNIGKKQVNAIANLSSAGARHQNSYSHKRPKSYFKR